MLLADKEHNKRQANQATGHHHITSIILLRKWLQSITRPKACQIAFAARDPLRNLWVVEWALIACALVIPLAPARGPLRGIPPFWRAIDCSFGVFGAVPLWLLRREIRRLAQTSG